VLWLQGLLGSCNAWCILRGRRDGGEDCCCVEVHFPAFKTLKLQGLAN